MARRELTVDGQRWDTGVEIRVGREPLQVAAAVTQGSLSYPRVRDDNDGKQFSGRLQGTPLTGLVLGLSLARGEYPDRELAADLPLAEAGRTRRQRAAGLDFEYSRDRRAEQDRRRRAQQQAQQQQARK